MLSRSSRALLCLQRGTVKRAAASFSALPVTSSSSSSSSFAWSLHLHQSCGYSTFSHVSRTHPSTPSPWLPALPLTQKRNFAFRGIPAAIKLSPDAKAFMKRIVDNAPDVKGIELDMKQASNGLSMVWSFDVVRETEDQRSGDNNEENNNSNDVNTNYGNNNDTNNDNNIDNGDSSGITPENSSGQTGEEADAEADGEYIHAASSSSRREQFSRMLRQSQEIVDCGDGVHVYIGKDAFLKVLGATVDFDTAEMRLKVLDREGNELHAG